MGSCRARTHPTQKWCEYVTISIKIEFTLVEVHSLETLGGLYRYHLSRKPEHVANILPYVDRIANEFL